MSTVQEPIPEITLTVHHFPLFGTISVCTVLTKTGEKIVKFIIPQKNGNTICLFDFRPVSIQAEENWRENREDKKAASKLYAAINQNPVSISVRDLPTGKEVVLKPASNDSESFCLISRD
jgi:hypothetical protein